MPTPIQAWQTIGEILYARLRNEGAVEPVDEQWARLSNGLETAVADVLYQLDHSRMRLAHRSRKLDLVKDYSCQVKGILEKSLLYRETLPSIFQSGGSPNPEVTRFIIDALGKIGDSQSKRLLLAIADDQQFGRDAVAAAEAIHLRLHTRR